MKLCNPRFCNILRLLRLFHLQCNSPEVTGESLSLHSLPKHSGSAPQQRLYVPWPLACSHFRNKCSYKSSRHISFCLRARWGTIASLIRVWSQHPQKPINICHLRSATLVLLQERGASRFAWWGCLLLLCVKGTYTPFPRVVKTTPSFTFKYVTALSSQDLWNARLFLSWVNQRNVCWAQLLWVRPELTRNGGQKRAIPLGTPDLMQDSQVSGYHSEGWGLLWEVVAASITREVLFELLLQDEGLGAATRKRLEAGNEYAQRGPGTKGCAVSWDWKAVLRGWSIPSGGRWSQGMTRSLCREEPGCLYLCALSTEPANTRVSENVYDVNRIVNVTSQRPLAYLWLLHGLTCDYLWYAHSCVHRYHLGHDTHEIHSTYLVSGYFLIINRTEFFQVKSLKSQKGDVWPWCHRFQNYVFMGNS